MWVEGLPGFGIRTSRGVRQEKHLNGEAKLCKDKSLRGGSTLDLVTVCEKRETCQERLEKQERQKKCRIKRRQRRIRIAAMFHGN